MGGDPHGQLGAGFGVAGTNAPGLIVSNNVTTISAGDYHTLFIRPDGSLWGMGADFLYELGLGTTNDVLAPQLIVSNEVTSIAGGAVHSLFLTFHPPNGPGGYWAMGYNASGQLGDGTTNNQVVPEQVLSNPSGNVFSVIADGEQHSLLVKPDGSLWATGWNKYGQLGDGTTTNHLLPKLIVASNVTAIAAGGDHSLFVKTDGSLWSMGNDTAGELGDGTNGTIHTTPELIVSNNVTSVAAGGAHSLFLKSDGSLWGMGRNVFGQLGDGTTNNRSIPVLIVSNNVTAVTAGFYHSLFIKSDGSLWAMGFNQSGQLGDGTYVERHIPVQIVPPPPRILSVNLSGGSFGMSFMTISSQSYTVQANLDLTTTNWFACTNFSGNGLIMPVAVPVSNGVLQEFFRVKEP
jgi:alpha-tubulin suppressor-like RCC1 family protein